MRATQSPTSPTSYLYIVHSNDPPLSYYPQQVRYVLRTILYLGSDNHQEIYCKFHNESQQQTWRRIDWKFQPNFEASVGDLSWQEFGVQRTSQCTEVASRGDIQVGWDHWNSTLRFIFYSIHNSVLPWRQDKTLGGLAITEIYSYLLKLCTTMYLLYLIFYYMDKIFPFSEYIKYFILFLHS